MFLAEGEHQHGRAFGAAQLADIFDDGGFCGAGHGSVL